MRRPEVAQWRRGATPIALALVSFLAAFVLWVAVTDAENPNRVAVFSGGIEVKAVNVPEGLAVASIRQPTVSVRVSANEDAFSKLTVGDFVAEVDLSGERRSASDQVVLVRVAGKKDVTITEVSPQVVTVNLEPTASKQVPVAVHRVGSLPQGFNMTGLDTNPPLVTVIGATSLVQLIEAAYADVNLTGLRASLQQQYPLTPRDPRGADIRNVQIQPGTADVRVTISQLEVTLAITVVPQIQGTVADGYSLIAVTPDPAAIAVSGPLESLQSLGTLSTEPIDVSGLRADLTRNARLRLPPGVTAPRDNVTVRLKVAPTAGEVVQSVAPQASGVPEGMRASFQTASINVRIRGDIPSLRALQPGAIRATVSAAGLEEGVHILTPTITAPENVQVAGAEPPQVVLVLRK
jgi:YbbR domain-containing protein